MRNNLERRRFDVPEFRVEKREGSELPDIVGYASVFNTEIDLGPFTESIAPGAFTESLEREDDVRALFNHDPNFILGRSKAGTLELREDAKGLFSRILPPDTQLGRDMVISIERGDISQMSFGFYIEKETLDNSSERKKPHFTVQKVRLFDVSPVTFPAYPTTEVEVERHAQEIKQSFEERLKSAIGNDDTARLMKKYFDSRIACLRAAILR